MNILLTILNTRSVSALECGRVSILKRFVRFGNLSAPLAVFISPILCLPVFTKFLDLVVSVSGLLIPPFGGGRGRGSRGRQRGGWGLRVLVQHLMQNGSRGRSQTL